MTNGFEKLSNSTFKSISTGFYYVSVGLGMQSNSSGYFGMNHWDVPYMTINYQSRMNTKFSLTTNYILRATYESPDFDFFSNFNFLPSSRIYETYLLVLKLNESKPYFSVTGNVAMTSNSYFSKALFRIFGECLVDNFECWNKTENMYKIPLTGNYYISFNIPFHKSSTITSVLELRVNNEPRLTAFTDCIYDLHYSFLVSNSAVFSLNKDDRIELFFKGHITDSLNRGTFNIFFID